MLGGIQTPVLTEQNTMTGDVTVAIPRWNNNTNVR